MSLHQNLALLVLLLFLPQISYSEIPSSAESVVKSQEKFVGSIASRASDLHSSRKEIIRRCKCSRHACFNDYSNSTCFFDVLSQHNITQEGRDIDYNSNSFRLPPGTDLDSLSGEIKESICLFQLLEDVADSKENEHGYVFVGTNDGHLRQFPSKEARRKANQTNDLGRCAPYDPRVTDWFVAGSTGPKDIVIIVDQSGSMDDIPAGGSTTKWRVAQDAVVKLIDSFSFADFVNIVTFSEGAIQLWTDSSMARATVENKEALKSLILSRSPSGGTDFRAGFDQAFRILIDGCKEDLACSNCQKIILFLTDGMDTSESSGDSVFPSVMAESIEAHQNRLKEEHGSKATIFTYSMTEAADDRIPRQIACMNNGSWSFVDENTEVTELLGSYYRYIAVNRKSDNPVWTEPVFNGESVVSVVSQPFYSPATESAEGVFLGVVGNDVEIEIEGFDNDTAEEVIRYIISRSGECSPPKDLPCRLQIFRNSSDELAQCVDHITNAAAADPLCHKFGSKYYKVFSGLQDWQTASDNCNADGGALASANNVEELGSIASLASADGSWIGLSYRRGVFRWEDSRTENVMLNSSFWGIGQPYNAEEGYCVTVDNRGKIGNLGTYSCGWIYTYICEYKSEDSCGKGVAKVPKRGYYSIPPSESCSVEEEGVLQVTLPVPEAAELRSNQVVCCEDYFVVENDPWPFWWLLVALCMAIIVYFTE